MEDFEPAEIKVNKFSLNWGPFIFLIPAATAETAEDGLIPYDTTIAAATVRAFVGTINPGTDLDDLTEITDTLIGPTAPIVEADKIRVRFTYPGDVHVGKSVALMFSCTLNDSTEQAFYFQSVSIQ